LFSPSISAYDVRKFEALADSLLRGQLETCLVEGEIDPRIAPLDRQNQILSHQVE